MKRVVITGIGALTPIGNNKDEYLQGLTNGVSGANLITQFDATEFKTRFACEVKDFDPEAFLDRRESRRIDRFAQFALVTADEAVTDAGLDAILEELDRDRIGVIWGSGIGGLKSLEKEISDYATGNGIPGTTPS
jgi:3-oxoacyl-[acyl-carrier-protein] synthase II